MSASRPTISSSLTTRPPPASFLGIAPWLWLAGPYLLALGLFLAVPLGNLVLLSAFQHSITTIWKAEVTLANYARLVDDYYVYLAVRSLRIGAVTTLLCVVAGYPVAYYLARCSQRALFIGMFLLVMPLMVSSVIRAFGWIVILGRKGVINLTLQALGFETPLRLLYTETAVIVALAQLVLPLMVLPLMAAIEKIPIALEETAVNLGASPSMVFRRLILPLSVPGLASGCLLCFTVSISVVVTPALLGGRNVRMFGNEIYDQVLTAYNWPFAASLSVTMIIVAILAITVGLRFGAQTAWRR